MFLVDRVNKPERSMELRKVFCVLVCCLGYSAVTISPAMASNVPFTESNDTCTRNFTMAAGEPPRPVTPDLLHPVHNNNDNTKRTSVTYDVKACSDVEVILYAVSFKPPQPRASVIRIVLGKNNESKSEIGHDGVGDDSEPENPLHCGEFRRFAVSWEKNRVSVFRYDPVNATWHKILKYPSTEPMEVDIHSVFLGYKLNEEDNSTSEWRLDVPCEDSVKESSGVQCLEDDSPSMVTYGHLAGAVITALLAGILFGVLCVVYIPKILKCIRDRQGFKDTKRGEIAHTDEELTTLVGVQSPEKPQSPGTTPGGTTQETKVDLSLPGDNPPPSSIDPSSSSSQESRKATNTYTPYHEMGGAGGSASTPTTTKKDDVSAKSTDVTRKPSGAGRIALPLPALPDAETGTAETDEVYVNADTHVYAGMRHEAPIYENRSTGVYEALESSGKIK